MAKKKASKGKKVSKGKGKNTVHYKAETWGMAREKFKRGERSRVFVTAKKCKSHGNCYVVTYRNRSKDTTKPKGTASSAVSSFWGGKVKPKKKTSKKKKGTKKKATKKKATKKKATKRRK